MLTKKTIFIGIVVLLFCVPVYSQLEKAQPLEDHVSLSYNGTFLYQPCEKNSRANSPNGVYWCRYDIAAVSDEVRRLENFTLFAGNERLFSMEKVPGSDVYISNSGNIAFMDMRFHFKGELMIHFYDKTGQALFSEQFTDASLFGFSQQGNHFGVGTAESLTIIGLADHSFKNIPRCDQFDMAENGKLLATAFQDAVRVYREGAVIERFNTGFNYPRKIKLSPDARYVAVIDKRNLLVYSIEKGELLFSDQLSGQQSFRDVLLSKNQIFAGIHYRTRCESKGILKTYDLNGKVLQESEQAVRQLKETVKPKKLKKTNSDENSIPWPFAPFDSMRTVWNYYEQHMGGYGTDFSYLHQGLDLIVPIAEPVYAVEAGYVKCVLTLGGAVYWRTAISKEQVDSKSKGWLYAHLIESSIQVGVGDFVEQHQYLGDIVQWHDDWGHIHFVEIEDSGPVWYYNDGEWGITFNPLLALTPDTDTMPPLIEPVFPHSKFGFCFNESSYYLEPDCLFGDIDIIVKVKDFIGDSPWEQPAFETFYWIKRIANNETIVPKTLGQRLNHAFDFYAAGHYEPYATTIYKRDSLLVPSSWMSQQRQFYHILTNNNGDEFVELAEKDLAFSTVDYPDGDYRIYVEARDEYGNATVDSMDVKFCNGNTGVAFEKSGLPVKSSLGQNHPNPFNPSTKICYTIGSPGFVKLTVYNVLGEQVTSLVSDFKKQGAHSVVFEANDLSDGIYFCRLKTTDQSIVRKMILMR